VGKLFFPLKPIFVKKVMWNTECPHETLHDGVCTACGLVVDTFAHPEKPTFIRKTSAPPSILKEMDIFVVEPEIKVLADSIYSELRVHAESNGYNICRRSTQRLKLIYFCLFEAYERMKIVVDPKALAKKINLPSGMISSAISEYTLPGTTRRQKTPLDFLGTYHNEFALPLDSLDDLVQFTRELLRKEPALLRESFPQNCAAAIVKYYIETRMGMENRACLRGQLGVSDVTISNLYKRICQIDNA